MRPFLDEWIAGKTGEPFTREHLEWYQLERLRQTVAHARSGSPFYRERLRSFPDGFPSSLYDFSRLPPTLPSELATEPERFIAVRQDDIARIVTLRTSGSTGEGKRLFFTGEDLAATVEIFRIGMASFVRPGGRALVLLPGERPGSIGDLLVRALAPERECILCPASDERRTLERIAESKAECLVGLPTQLLSLARSPHSSAGENALSSAVLRRLRRAEPCRRRSKTHGSASPAATTASPRRSTAALWSAKSATDCTSWRGTTSSRY